MKNKFSKRKFLNIGSIINIKYAEDKEAEPYMLCAIGEDKGLLICMNDGNRLSDETIHFILNSNKTDQGIFLKDLKEYVKKDSFGFEVIEVIKVVEAK